MSVVCSISLGDASASELSLSSPRVARSWLCFWLIVVTAAYALLWSPDWYPLSDSSLYLSLGRSLAGGRGLTMMGDPVKLTPPLAPLLISLIIKAGGGIGAIQGVMIALMVLSHVICFLALRRIVGERLALCATVAGAMSYWVFANALTIMSEPPCLVFLWAAMWTLTTVKPEHSRARRLWTIAGACLLIVIAAASRDAVIGLSPGLFLLLPGTTRPAVKVGAILGALGLGTAGVLLATRGMWLTSAMIPVAIALLAWFILRRDTFEKLFDRLRMPATRPQAWGYFAIFTIVLGGWLILYRYPPKFLAPSAIARSNIAATPAASTAGAESPTALAPMSSGDDEDLPREGRYKAQWLYGVKRDHHLITDPPILGGRWICEGLAMPAVAIFESKIQNVAAAGVAIALAAMALCILGLVMLLRRGHWWLLGPVLYFMAIWLQWGTRIKPRYMVPIAPFLFILLWAGICAIILVLRKTRPADYTQTKRGSAVAGVLLALVILANAFPWWIEFRIRHGARDFYDVARCGAFGDLVDIAAWLQKNAGPQENVWMNAGAHRRIAYFLSGRPIQTRMRDAFALNWNDWVGQNLPGPKAERRAKILRDLRHAVPPQDRFILIYFEQPQPGVTWPGWHWPRPAKKLPSFWMLVQRTGENQWTPVEIPRSDRTYVRSIPPAGI